MSLPCFSDFSDNNLQPCFFRCIGTSYNLIDELQHFDDLMSVNYIYKRINKFDILSDVNKIQDYQKKYNDLWKTNRPFQKMLSLYRQSISNFNPTIEKNLIVSVLYWYDLYLKEISEKSGKKKFVCSGKIGYKEYLFCYFAYLMKFDVMIINPEGEIKVADILLKQSKLFNIGNEKQLSIPEYKEKVVQKPINKPQVNNVKAFIPQKPKQRRELSYEELARLAKSVVMIGVHDKSGNIIGSGSGIAISRKGYILTNFHVITKGVFYSVRIENDEKIYPCYQVIKYHTDCDMAVIQIEKELDPLTLYNGNSELVRGQKVVAIGSPMGLFNSVSDGIIAGFREIEDQEMIQFTAPISSGSSGGALLNIYGEVIGISTASIDKAQNMNLAVSYKQINPFIRGFLK